MHIKGGARLSQKHPAAVIVLSRRAYKLAVTEEALILKEGLKTMTAKQPGIASLALTAIGHPGVAERWMNERRALFGGRTPLEALDNPEGQRRVARQLQWFAGREKRPALFPAQAKDGTLTAENPSLRR